MINAKFVPVCLAILVFIAPVLAQDVSVSNNGRSGGPTAEFMRLSDVKEGMKGTARTVFSGTEPEEFRVEILGVIPGAVGPRQDLIVGRLSGGGADRTAVFAGMSGSPVYIGGRLVGAISYSFPFAKEPICGITPIEQMISIFEQKQLSAGQPAEPRPFSFSELTQSSLVPELPSGRNSAGIASGMGANSAMMAVAGQSFQPIATPLTFTGVSKATLDVFAPELIRAGMLPVAAAGGAAAIGPLKKADAKTLVGGTSVMMQLTRGDLSLAAAGTVTYRNGNKIYAFGHPFLSLGSSDLPMSESHVVTVVPNVNNSFKLAVPDAMVGSMTQDRATGVFGQLGQAPKMIPVRINVRNSRGNTEVVNLEIAKDEFLTPLLLNISVFNSVISQERSLGDTTVEILGTLKLKGQEPVSIQRRFTGPVANQLAAASLAAPVSALLRSRFDELEMTGIEVDVTSMDGTKTGVLERVLVDRTRVHPGETVELQAFARTNAGRTFVHKIPLTIPSGTPAGPLTVVIGDGSSLQPSSPTQHFVPRSLSDLVKTINRIKLPDRLYVQTTRTTAGAIIGSSEMPNLPPSVLATLNNERTVGGIKPFVQTVVSEIAVPPAEFIIAGQQTISIEIIK